MPYKDISKRRESQKKYYKSHKKLYYLKNIARRKQLMEFINEQKDKPCADCGVKYPSYVMDFDHRDRGEKFSSVSQMATLHYASKEKIIKEINKCDLVCSNCHRIRTHCRIV